MQQQGLGGPKDWTSRQAFRERLAANDIDCLEWILGKLLVHTAYDLLQLTDREWEKTLKLIPSKRPGVLVDLEDDRRYVPVHFARLRRLRQDVLREATSTGAAVAASEPEEPEHQDDDMGAWDAMHAATTEALKQLTESVSKVRELLGDGHTGQDIANAYQNLIDAMKHFENNLTAEGAASSLKCIRQAAKSMSGPPAQPQAQATAVKVAERAVRDVVVWRGLIRVDPRDRKAFLKSLQLAFGVSELDTDLQAQLLLSHRKIASSVIDSFLSNGQRATLGRGAARGPRRKRGGQASAIEVVSDAHAQGFDQDPVFWRAKVYDGRFAPGGPQAGGGACFSTTPLCDWSAAIGDPQYVVQHNSSSAAAEHDNLCWSVWSGPSFNPFEVPAPEGSEWSILDDLPSAGCSGEVWDVLPGLAAGPSTSRLLSALAECDDKLQDQVRACYDEISRCIGSELTLSLIISRRPEIFEGLLGEVLQEQTAEKQNLFTAMDILMSFASGPIAPKASCPSGPSPQLAEAGPPAFPVG